MATWLTDFQFRRKFTIDNSEVDASLSDFPVALPLSNSAGLGADDLSDIFTELAWVGDDFDELDLDAWTKIGQDANVTITGNKLRCHADNGDVSGERQGVLSNFELNSTQDFDIQVDFEVVAGGSGANSWYAELMVSFQGQTGQPTPWDTAYLCQRLYFNGHSFDGVGVEDGVFKTRDSDANSATSGKFRITKSGNTLTTFYDAGSGFVQGRQDTFTDFDGFNAKVGISALCDSTQPSITVDYSNFVINSGTVEWPAGANPNRKKIAVTTDDEVTQRPVEIEWFDHEKALLHTRIPSVASDSTTDIYFYYDSSASNNITYVGDTDSTAAQAVWDSDFVFVTHLNNDVTNLTKESTSYSQTGQPQSMEAGDMVDGLKGGKAINFDGSNEYIDFSSPAQLDDIALMTVESLVNLTNYGESSAGRIIQKANVNNGWHVFGKGDTTAFGFLRDSSGGIGQWSTPDASLPLSTYKYVVVSHDRGSINNDPVMYIDGISLGVSEDFTPSGTWDNDAAEDMWIAARDNSGPDREFDGLIGEIRISKVIRPAEWLKATYNTLFDTFGTWSALEGGSSSSSVSSFSSSSTSSSSSSTSSSSSVSSSSSSSISSSSSSSSSTSSSSSSKSSESCFVSPNDDFTGTNGDPPNVHRWESAATGTGSLPEIQSNECRTDIPSSGVGSSQIKTRYLIGGNFDVEAEMTC
ncbi:hypothetical protein KAR91_41275, partial [Candidatus Pacearchaeota archaeon]|nr:hypothetical protein [Candidatus Pacearchaeota archaeon]